MTECVNIGCFLLMVHRGKAILSKFLCESGDKAQLKEHCEAITGEVLTCGVLLNSSSGLVNPHVLVRGIDHSARANYEVLTCGSNPGDHSWKSVMKFQVSKRNCPNSNHFHLSDGPCVLWSQGPYIHATCGQKISLNVNSVAANSNIDRVTKVWCVSKYNQFPFIRLGLQVVLQDPVAFREFGDRDWISIEINFRGTPTITRVPDFIPGCYGSIATYIATQKEYFFDQCNGSLKENHLYVVGTELKQAVVVNERKVVCILSMDFVPQQLSTTMGSVGRLIVVARSGQGETCAHELVKECGSMVGSDKEWTWTELGRWTGVRIIKTGDFLQTGATQLLLLKETNEFILTNFRDVNISSQPSRTEEPENMEEGTSRTGSDCPTSLLNVLKGLRLKKHAGEAQLVQYEASEQRKRHLLVKSLSFMEALGCGGAAIPSPDPGLLCVVPGNLGQSSSPKPTRELPRKFQILKVWQRLCNGQWVLGILAKNISQSSIKNAAVSLVVPEQQLVKNDICRVMWNETFEKKKAHFIGRLALESVLKPPPAKQRKLTNDTSDGDGTVSERSTSSSVLDAGDAVTFVLHTEPIFPELGAVVVVSWSEAGENGLERNVSEELAHVQLDKVALYRGELDIDKNCLELWQGEEMALEDGRTLSVRDFFRTAVQSLVSLLVVHSLTQIKVTSKHTSLWRLPSMLKAKFPSSKFSIQVSQPAHVKQETATSLHSPAATPCLVSSHDMGALGAMGCTALHVRLQTQAAVISILHRRVHDRECILKLLHDSLPNDISLGMLAESQSKVQECLLSSLTAIMEEAREKAVEVRDHLTKGDCQSSTNLQESNLQMLTNIAMSALQL